MKFNDLIKRINVKNPKTLNVVHPLSDSIYEALKDISDRGWLNLRLYGPHHAIDEQCAKYELKNAVVIGSSEPDIGARMAVTDIKSGLGDLLMKGDIQTAAFMKPVLNREYGLRKGQVISHIAVVEHPGLPSFLFISDGGINIDLTLETRRVIAMNAAEFAAMVLKRHPVIAFTALVETANDKLPETLDSKILAEEFTRLGYLSDGPVALDVVFSVKAATKKGVSAAVSEKTDIIIAPNITTANFLVKEMISLGNAAVGGIICGATVPLILLSRSDDAATKLNSIILALMADQ